MSDILEQIDILVRQLGTQNWTGEVLDRAAYEIRRLRSGGCVREQGTTQFCAEAARLAKENLRLHAVAIQCEAEAGALAATNRDYAAEIERLRAASDLLAASNQQHAATVADLRKHLDAAKAECRAWRAGEWDDTDGTGFVARFTNAEGFAVADAVAATDAAGGVE